jgi:putative PIN family toxin of toxin-antitoxin system
VKVALDTSVLASALGTRGLCADLMRVVLTEQPLVIGEWILGELQRSLAKKFRLPKALIEEYVAMLRAQAGTIAEGGEVGLMGIDSGDAHVLGEALTGHADILVTGDQQLQALGERAPLPILSPRQFWDLLRRGA